MRGHELLVAMRTKGRRPHLALIDILPAYSVFSAEWDRWTGGPAHIEVLESESVFRLDLRCVVGMAVIVSGTNGDRVDEVHGACKRAGAASVVSTVLRTGPRRGHEGPVVRQRVTGFEVAHG